MFRFGVLFGCLLCAVCDLWFCLVVFVCLGALGFCGFVDLVFWCFAVWLGVFRF